jgi:hypothetical protein
MDPHFREVIENTEYYRMIKLLTFVVGKAVQSIFDDGPERRRTNKPIGGKRWEEIFRKTKSKNFESSSGLEKE